MLPFPVAADGLVDGRNACGEPVARYIHDLGAARADAEQRGGFFLLGIFIDP